MADTVHLDNLDDEIIGPAPVVKPELDVDGTPIHVPAGPEGEMEQKVDASGQPTDEENYDKFAEPGRVRRFATILNLLNSLLGAGILGVPKAMDNCGIIPSVLLLLLIGVLSHVATVLTVKLQYRTQAAGLDELTGIVMGKIGSVALSILVMLFCISCMVAYLIIGTDIIISWLSLAGVTVGTGIYRTLLVLANAFICPILLTLPRQVKFLTYFSLACFVCIVFFVFAMILKSILVLPKDGVHPTVQLGTANMMGYFRAISIFGLAFALPITVLPLIGPYNKDLQKRSTVSFWSCLLCFVFVSIPGVLGYLIKGNEARDNILLSFGDGDVLMIIVRAGFYFVVTFSYPAIAQSMLASWSQVIYKQNDNSTLPNNKRIWVLLLTNAFPLIIAMALPNAGPALSVGGAMGGCLVDFFFPPVMWIMLSKQKWYSLQNILCLLLAVFGLVAAVISTTLAVIDAFSA